jgi:eukaryotic-like serine/threonine-protein kinase
MKDDCPEPETIAAYLDGNASPEEKAFIERHIANCRECRMTIALAVRSERDVPEMPQA